MEAAVIVGMLSLIRIATLSGERIALNQLGQARFGILATMGIGFGGAALVLWSMNVWQGSELWVDSVWWTGALYAVAFGFYTASLARGPVSVVSPWSNATVIILWFLHPVGGSLAWLSLAIFGAGALVLTERKVSYPVIWMLISDVLLAIARVIDVHHIHHAPISYATSLFTVIGLWMFIPIVVYGKLRNVVQLMTSQPGWSFVAASSNAAAYLALFCLLRWLHPAAVEAISAVASSVAAAIGVFFYHEAHAGRKIASSVLMTMGTILLLYAQSPF